MSNKQLIISAIKEMDIVKLELLLDNQRPYMDVPKQLFLKNLKQQFDYKKEDQIFSFEKIIPGLCNSCNKGCVAYRFLTTDNVALDLYFEEKEEQITDIYLCNVLKFENENTPRYKMHFDFYKDEKVNFTPTIEFQIKKQKIDIALLEFENFKDKIVPVEDIHYYCKKHSNILKEFCDFPFLIEYKQFKAFNDFSLAIKNVITLINKHKFAKQAMSELNAVENEKELVYWIFTYKWTNLNNYGFKPLKGWEKSSFMVLNKNDSVIIDCSNYHESLEFSYYHNKHENDLIKKYEPTPEHFKNTKKGIEYSLESHLRIHGMYLDILPEEK